MGSRLSADWTQGFLVPAWRFSDKKPRPVPSEADTRHGPLGNLLAQARAKKIAVATSCDSRQRSDHRVPRRHTASDAGDGGTAAGRSHPYVITFDHGFRALNQRTASWNSGTNGRLAAAGFRRPLHRRSHPRDTRACRVQRYPSRLALRRPKHAACQLL